MNVIITGTGVELSTGRIVTKVSALWETNHAAVHEQVTEIARELAEALDSSQLTVTVTPINP